MDSYKTLISSTDDCGFLTAGEDRVLSLTLTLNGTAQLITGSTFESTIPAEDGGSVVLPNSAHTIVEDGVDPLLNGRVNLTISAAAGKRIALGRRILLAVRLTNAGLSRFYWGVIDEVRDYRR